MPEQSENRTIHASTSRKPTPKTSEALLIAIASDPQSERWNEFVRRYEPMMREFMASKFPDVDADDAIQETLCALVRLLPSYRYAPDETGLFRSYLLGVLKNKALMAIRTEARRDKREHGAALLAEIERSAARPMELPGEGDEEPEEKPEGEPSAADERRKLRHVAYELALREFFDDPAVMPRTKEIFRRVALSGDPPAEVAELYGISRNAVDQIKARSVARIRKLAERLESGG